jgi:hypothetical protein
MRLLVFLVFWIAIFAVLILGFSASSTPTNNDGGPMVGILIAGAGFVYFLPTSIGFIRKHRYRWMILLANLFVGWTGAGLLALFAWSVWPKNTPLNPPLEHSLMAPLGSDADDAEVATQKGNAGPVAIGVVGVLIVLAWGWVMFQPRQATQQEVTEPVQAVEAAPAPEAAEVAAPATEAPATLVLGVVRDDVLEAGAGCVATNVGGESVFVTDFAAAAIAFNGETNMLAKTGEQQGVEIYADATNAVRVSITRTGDPVETSEESSAWPAILTLSAEGRETTLAVTLTCGS